MLLNRLARAKCCADIAPCADFSLILRRLIAIEAAPPDAVGAAIVVNMKVIRTVEELRDWTREVHASGRTLGFVPTMGALHDGHLSLVDAARAATDAVAVSVFVNPTQFNNPTDLATYPRNEAADLALLSERGVDAVFVPTVEEMYPEGEAAAKDYEFKLGPAAEVMEGKFRPGHFQGVAQVVSRMLRYSDADKAFFGEKDFQQIAVVRAMVESEGIRTEIVSCPILRAADGLALSSRNALLTPEQRAIAPGIYETLAYSREYSREHSVQATHDTVVERIDAMPDCRVEYFEIVDARTLLPVAEWEDTDYIVGCITVYCGRVRLIDNITYRPLP